MITPFLWFDDRAEEAMNFYVSIFKDAKVGTVNRYGSEGPGKPGTVMTATFTLDGQDFIALNGGPEYTFTPAVSFLVSCETQREVDHYWDKLSAGGKTNRCGWLTDKFGLTWQIVPSILSDLLSGEDDEKSSRAMQAMLKMTKLDIAELQHAYDGA
ncbi:MAG: VOC family protein [Candidatus Eremiobacteraeota bacterium]|nr:VOC family protein [Candidatus Eremiobacteraeota bacterium]